MLCKNIYIVYTLIDGIVSYFKRLLFLAIVDMLLRLTYLPTNHLKILLNRDHFNFNLYLFTVFRYSNS